MGTHFRILVGWGVTFQGAPRVDGGPAPWIRQLGCPSQANVRSGPDLDLEATVVLCMAAWLPFEAASP